MLKVGEQAPDFSLPDSTGRHRTLVGLLATGPLVLFFYPADFTPICTAQACMFRDRHAELAAAGVQVVGVSAQGQDSHHRFQTELQLPYPILCDPHRIAIRKFAARWFGIPLPAITRRVTYLIDTQRTVRARVLADLSASAHASILQEAMVLRDSA